MQVFKEKLLQRTSHKYKALLIPTACIGIALLRH